MLTVRTVAELRERLAPDRREGRRIGLVPTMGALHDGHLSLIEAAREGCDMVVVSLFVNPTQFNEAADLARYPRDEARDAAAAAAAGADVLFAPGVQEVYPDGFATSVEVLGPALPLEGESRGAGHFRGVTTVVAKLMWMVQPDAAYFGQKDAQQVIVIRRMAADLNIPVEIIAMPIVRERDGLAMSSRNALLSPQERLRALSLSRALEHVGRMVAEGESSGPAIEEAALAVLAQGGAEAEYAALVDPETLQPVAELCAPALLALAARVGAVRLIDNATLAPSAATAGRVRGGEAVAACSA